MTQSTIATGICQLFLQHTSASIIICENYDPEVQQDLETFMSRLVRDGDVIFKHTAEGDDDMSSHVRTLLTKTDLTVPICKGKLALGTWQGIFLWEHRTSSFQRKLTVTLLGE